MNNIQKRRIAVWGVMGLVLVVLVGMAVVPDPVPADFETVTRGELRITLDHEGKTRVRERFEVSAPLQGKVLRIDLEPGDPVRAGETILATFQPSEPVPLDSRSRAEALATVKAARSSLERARADRERVRAERDLAAAELHRQQRLADAGIVSQQLLETFSTDARARAEALSAAEAAARSAAHDLEIANAHLLEPGEGGSTASGATPILTLRSPVDGVVLRRLRESEAIVPAGEPLLEVADLRDLEIVADFLSSDAVRMHPGMPVQIDRWGGEKVLAGRVRRVEPAGFLKISALGVEEQRVNVVIDFVDPEEVRSLGDGYRVEARVVVEEYTDVLKVPNSSLFREGGKWAAFVVDGGRADLRAVEIGSRNDLEALVVSGLEEGDQVVIHSSDAVVDGVRVVQRGS